MTPANRFLLTAGFFETHRPYPRDRYEPADAAAVDTPDYLPNTVEVRQDLAEFYGSITTADAAVGRILDTLADTGLDASTWVVFLTDHGAPFPACEIHALRGGNRNRDDCAPSHPNGVGAPRFTTICSAGWICCRHCWNCSVRRGRLTSTAISHAQALIAPDPAEPVRAHVYTTKT